MRRTTIAIRRDDAGTYAWIETRLPGGRAVNRQAALAALHRECPRACRTRFAEQWHVPFRMHVFKVYFEGGERAGQ
jgi:hypothetical protein